MTPNHVHGVITSEYITLHGKGSLQMWLRILKWGDYPGLFRWARGNHKSPCKMEVGGSEWEKEAKVRVWERLEDSTLLSVKMKDVAMSLRMQVASRSWKRQGNRLFPRASRRNAALLTLWFYPVRAMAKFRPPETYNNKFVLCEATKFAVIFIVAIEN